VVDRGERVSVADRQQQGRSRSQVSPAWWCTQRCRPGKQVTIADSPPPLPPSLQSPSSSPPPPSSPPSPSSSSLASSGVTRRGHRSLGWGSKHALTPSHPQILTLATPMLYGV